MTSTWIILNSTSARAIVWELHVYSSKMSGHGYCDVYDFIGETWTERTTWAVREGTPEPPDRGWYNSEPSSQGRGWTERVSEREQITEQLVTSGVLFLLQSITETWSGPPPTKERLRRRNSKAQVKIFRLNRSHVLMYTLPCHQSSDWAVC